MLEKGRLPAHLLPCVERAWGWLWHAGPHPGTPGGYPAASTHTSVPSTVGPGVPGTGAVWSWPHPTQPLAPLKYYVTVLSKASSLDQKDTWRSSFILCDFRDDSTHRKGKKRKEKKKKANVLVYRRSNRNKAGSAQWPKQRTYKTC